ncbi:piggyBac transposable element-derived protein 4-like [Anthonomus grandis grandis]|uniref:piggyBac transposable element-derived protein 4-like n=1 Tax=Anthonomus grandis grandis TaxID=2921223 RepID=UPI002166B09A|nr:piggyBac transposable element-derived protein 4-like [Anthonomus grandis grandis]
MSSEHDPFSGDDDSDYEADSGELNESSTSTSRSNDGEKVKTCLPDQTDISSDSENEREEEVQTSAERNLVWESTIKDPLDLTFDGSNSGIRQNIDNMTPIQVYELIWTRDIMNLLVEKTNEYGEVLCLQNRPKKRNERFRNFQPVSIQEMKQFFGLCPIGGRMKCRSVRKLFSLDPIYYHPIFSATMSGRRFEQILRCLNYSSDDKNDTAGKVSLLLKKIIKNSQDLFYPQEALSLDESLLLFRVMVTSLILKCTKEKQIAMMSDHPK